MSKGLQSGVVPGQADQEALDRKAYTDNLFNKIDVYNANEGAINTLGWNNKALDSNFQTPEDDQMYEDYTKEHGAFKYSQTPEDIEQQLYEDQYFIGNAARTMGRYAGKTLLQTAGNLGGMIYGTVAAINAGDFSAFYDNNFTNFIDDAEKELKSSLRIYQSKDYKDANFAQKLFTSPSLFVDEVMDSIAFTSGMILAEVITGGLASSSIIAKLSVSGAKALRIGAKGINNAQKGLKATDKAADFVKSMDKAGRVGIGTDVAKVLRQTFVTGATWEGIVETKSSMADLTKQLKSQGYSDNETEQRVAEAEKLSLGMNIAVVGLSSFTQFGKTLGTPEFLKIGKNLTKFARNGRIPGSMVKMANKELKMISPWKQNLMLAGHLVKNPLSEGMEEFSQGVISNGLINSYGKSYDHEEVELSDIANGFTKAASKGLTTKEGWNEIGMGMLVGLIGSPSLSNRASEKNNNDNKAKLRLSWDGGIAGDVKAHNIRKKEYESNIEKINNNDMFKSAQNIMGGIVASDQASNNFLKNTKEGKYYGAKNAHDDIVYSNFMPFIESGFGELAKARIGVLQDMSDEDFADAVMNPEQAEMIKQEPNRLKTLREQFNTTIDSQVKAAEDANRVVSRSKIKDPAVAKQAKYYYYKAKSGIALNDEFNAGIDNILSKHEKANDMYKNMKDNYSIPVADELSGLESNANMVKTVTGNNNEGVTELNQGMKDLTEATKIEGEKERKDAMLKAYTTVATLAGHDAAAATLYTALDETLDDESRESLMANIRDMYDHTLLKSEQAVLDAIPDTEIEDKQSLKDYFKAVRSNELLMNEAVKLFNKHLTGEEGIVKDRENFKYDRLFNALNPEILNTLKTEEDINNYLKSVSDMRKDIDQDIFDEREKESVLGKDNKRDDSIGSKIKKIKDKLSKNLKESEKKFNDNIDEVNKKHPKKDLSEFSNSEKTVTKEDNDNQDFNDELDDLISKRAESIGQKLLFEDMSRAMEITISRTEDGLPVDINSLQSAINYLYSVYKSINTSNREKRIENGLTTEQVKEVSSMLEDDIEFLTQAKQALQINKTLTRDNYEENKSKKQDKLKSTAKERTDKDSQREKIELESEFRAYNRDRNKLIGNAKRERTNRDKALNDEADNLISKLDGMKSDNNLDAVTYSDRMRDFQKLAKDRTKEIEENEKLISNIDKQESPLKSKDEGSNNNPDNAPGLDIKYIEPDKNEKESDTNAKRDNNNDLDKNKSYNVSVITYYTDKEGNEKDPSYRKQMTEFVKSITQNIDLSKSDNTLKAKIKLVKLGDDLDPRNGTEVTKDQFREEDGSIITPERFNKLILEKIDGKPKYGFQITISDKDGNNEVVSSLWTGGEYNKSDVNGLIDAMYIDALDKESSNDISTPSDDIYISERFKGVKGAKYNDTNLSDVLVVDDMPINELPYEKLYEFWNQLLSSAMLSVTNREGDYMFMSDKEGSSKWEKLTSVPFKSSVKGKFSLIGDGTILRNGSSKKPFKLNSTPISKIPGMSELAADIMYAMLNDKRFDVNEIEMMHAKYVEVTGDQSLEHNNDMQNIFNSILYNGQLNEKASKEYGVRIETGKPGVFQSMYINGSKYVVNNSMLTNPKTGDKIEFTPSNILNILNGYPNLRVNIDVKRLVESDVSEGSYKWTVLNRYLSTESNHPIRVRTGSNGLELSFEENEMTKYNVRARIKTPGTSKQADGVGDTSNGGTVTDPSLEGMFGAPPAESGRPSAADLMPNKDELTDNDSLNNSPDKYTEYTFDGVKYRDYGHKVHVKNDKVWDVFKKGAKEYTVFEALKSGKSNPVVEPKKSDDPYIKWLKENRSKGTEQEGILILENNAIKSPNGKPAGARFDRTNRVVLINSNVLKDKFKAKSWTKPFEQSDGTFANAISDNEFSTFEEFKMFVIQHEIEHSKYSRVDYNTEHPNNQTLGGYETEINKRALNAIYEANPFKRLEPIFENTNKPIESQLLEEVKGSVLNRKDDSDSITRLDIFTRIITNSKSVSFDPASSTLEIDGNEYRLKGRDLKLLSKNNNINEGVNSITEIIDEHNKECK